MKDIIPYDFSKKFEGNDQQLYRYRLAKTPQIVRVYAEPLRAVFTNWQSLILIKLKSKIFICKV